jgi:hypothetical protein
VARFRKQEGRIDLLDVDAAVLHRLDAAGDPKDRQQLASGADRTIATIDRRLCSRTHSSVNTSGNSLAVSSSTTSGRRHGTCKAFIKANGLIIEAS